jgi:hypothetical protein
LAISPALSVTWFFSSLMLSVLHRWGVDVNAGVRPTIKPEMQTKKRGHVVAPENPDMRG